MKLGRILLIVIVLFAFAPGQAQQVNKVVIDAGHGGKDPGAIGATGLYEKDVALSVTLMVGKYIEENYPDVEVIYTRDTDVFLELHERSSIANNNNADLFISIHANSAGSSAAYGTETFVLGAHKNAANLEVAKRENGVIELEDNTEEAYSFNPNSTEGHIIMAAHQSAYLEQSIQLAANVQYQFTERVKRKDRGVKQAGFYVLYKTTMPSILIELGFLSNVDEEAFLRSELGKDYMASAIYRAFRDYKDQIDAYWIENNVVNTVPEIIPEQDGLTYRVQLYASQSKAKNGAKIYQDFTKVFVEDNGQGIFRHMVNEYSNYETASQDLLKIVGLGYKGAYVVSYDGDNRVQVFDVTTDR